MIKKYKLFKESLLDYMKGPTEEELRNDFFNKEISMFSIIKLLKMNIITFDDVYKKFPNSGNFILKIISVGNFYNNLTYDDMIKYNISPDMILHDTLFEFHSHKKREVKNLDGFIFAIKNGAKLEKIPRYKLINLLEGDNEIIIEVMLKYFIDKKIPYSLLSMKANENIIKNHKDLLDLRDEYMKMCNDYNDDLVNIFDDFFEILPKTPEDFINNIIENIVIEEKELYICYYYNNKMLFYKPHYIDDYVYIRKIIIDVLEKYYKLNSGDLFGILKKYIIEKEPIKSKPIIWDEKLFRQYDKK